MKARLIKKKKETSDIWTYFFDPEQAFDYTPGTFLYLTLPKINSDPRGDTRHFSISSSPTEKLLSITIKEGISEYKKALNSLKEGEYVDIDGPHGVYHWSYEEAQPHVFIAGGIGITPFRSRIKHNSDKNISSPIHLLYSYRTSHPFEKELIKWDKKHHWLTFVSHNSTKLGRISAQILSEMTSVKNSIIWICGSTAFVNDIEDTLLQLNIDPDLIKTEKFTGY